MRQQTLFAICLSAFWVATECYRFLQRGFAGLIVGVIVTLATPAPGKDVEDLYDQAVEYDD